jgi:hypothetical protein
MGLTENERRTIDQARQLADLHGTEAICQHAGNDDVTGALAAVFGEAQAVLTELATITYRLALRSTAGSA